MTLRKTLALGATLKGADATPADVLEGRARWCVVEGDCLAALSDMATASIHAVVTDPPYCSGGFSEAARRGAKGQGLRSETIREVGWFINDNMGTAGLAWFMRALAIAAADLLMDGGSLLAFCDWRMVVNLAPAMESSGLRYQQMIVWDKGSAGLGTGFRAQHEIVLHFVKGVGRFHDASAGNVLRSLRVPNDDREHQTQKPVDLLQRLVRVVAPSDGVVLDPFCGSGTTGVAAIIEGRRFIGIEREAKYCAIARRRIADAEAQGNLFEAGA